MGARSEIVFQWNLSRSEPMEKKALENAGQAYHYTYPGAVEAR